MPALLGFSVPLRGSAGVVEHHDHELGVSAILGRLVPTQIVCLCTRVCPAFKHCPSADNQSPGPEMCAIDLTRIAS